MDQEQRNIANFLAGAMARANGYAARNEIEKIVRSCAGDPKRLEPFGFKVYSQNDEDGIIQEICRRLDIHNGRFCEIGVENGLECNSLYLLHKGWSGCWIEANQNYTNFIKTKFQSVLGRRLHLLQKLVTAENVDECLAAVRTGDGEIDLLSIDIDGNDVYLLQSMSSSPKIVCIEYNAKFPGDIVKQQKYDPQRRWAGTDYMGSSLKAVTRVAEQKGYRLVGTSVTGANAFFVRNDLARDLFPEDASSEHLYNPARYWLTFDHYRNIGHPADFGPYVDLEP
jgi:hypothetical protein